MLGERLGSLHRSLSEVTQTRTVLKGDLDFTFTLPTVAGASTECHLQAVHFSSKDSSLSAFSYFRQYKSDIDTQDSRKIKLERQVVTDSGLALFDSGVCGTFEVSDHCPLSPIFQLEAHTQSLSGDLRPPSSLHLLSVDQGRPTLPLQ